MQYTNSMNSLPVTTEELVYLISLIVHNHGYELQVAVTS